MHLTHVVVQGDLGCSFNLRDLTLKLENVRYNPRSFSALIWQHRIIGGNCLLFTNGKINCNGRCLSFQDGKRRLRRYARILQKLGYEIRLKNVRVVTASAVHKLDGTVNPMHLPREFSYEPELFHGVMLRRKGIHYTCRLSGILMITGIKDEKDMDDIHSVILEMELIRQGRK